MTSSELKELLPDFLKTLENSSIDEQILSYRTINQFLFFLKKQHKLSLQETNKICNHNFMILDKIYIKSPHWWDSHEITTITILQQCTKCGKIKKEKF